MMVYSYFRCRNEAKSLPKDEKKLKRCEARMVVLDKVGLSEGVKSKNV